MHPHSYLLCFVTATLLFPVVDLAPAVTGQHDANALAQTPTLQDPKAEAGRLLQQGYQQNQLGQFQDSIQSWQQALEIYRTLDERLGQALSLGGLGDDYAALSQYQQAIEFYEQAIALCRAVGNQQVEAFLLTASGEVYRKMGLYERAISVYQQSLAIAREVDDHQQERSTLNELGDIYLFIGQYQDAIAVFEQSLAAAQEVGDRQSQARILHDLASAYLGFGQYQQAIKSFEDTLIIAREVGDRQVEAGALSGIGAAYIRQGRYRESVEYLENGLAIAREIGDLQVEANTIINLSNTYFFLRQYPKIIQLSQRFVKIAPKLDGTNGVFIEYIILGNTLIDLGNYQRAVEFFNDALTLAHNIGSRSQEAYVLNGLGAAYIRLQRYDEAIKEFEQVLSIAQELDDAYLEADALGNLGITYRRLRQYQRSIEFAEQYLVKAREIGDRQGEAGALTNLSIALFDSNQFSEAADHLFHAIEIWESLRIGLPDASKISFIDSQTSTYQYLQRSLIVQNEIEKALEVAERGRARAFVEQLAQRLGSQETAEALIATNIPTVQQIKQIAQEENSTLVEYSIVSDEELYVWVIKPTGEVTFQSVDLKSLHAPLASLVSASRESIGVTRSQFVTVRPREGTEEQLLGQQTQHLRKLHQLLIEPIAKYLPTDPNAPVIFVPQGELFLVPFPALQDANGTYLIDQHTILTAPSIQVLEKTRQERSQVQQANLQQALVVGNPTMPSIPPAVGEPTQTLAALPGAGAEARAIAPLLHTQPLTENQAKKAAIVQQMPNARIIHLATHGLFDDTSGLNSAIALAPDGTGEPGDGLLTAADLAQMKLNAELVVLSACSTGQGQITGDGVIGLSRSLITAGVPSIIVSLWSVPDAPTAQLMTEFYHQFQQTGNKAQALRQAMLATRANHPNPRDWAAFTLIGEEE